MSDAHIIELFIPGLLPFRDMALRVIMESCRLVGKLDDAVRRANTAPPRDPRSRSFDLEDSLTVAMTSAFSEIYNNIAIHAYGDDRAGTIGLAIHIGSDRIIVEVTDMGRSFAIDDVPAPGELPTGGMGIHIARAMLDDLQYKSGPPNRWRLVKYLANPSRAETAAAP